MPTDRPLPKTASVALPANNGKLHAPSAARNGGAIITALTGLVPQKGRALEIASGTGEHMLRLATAFPALSWQPTDIDPARLTSIKAWCDEAGLSNVKPPVMLNAGIVGWAENMAGQNLVFLSNLLHLISEKEAGIVVAEAAKALAPDGVFIVYGPFLRGTAYASPADQHFDESLRASAPDIGYKSYETIQRLQAEAGLTPLFPLDMPANNLLLAARKTVAGR